MEKRNQQEEYNIIKPRQKVPPHIDKLKKHQLIIELILLSVSVIGFFVSHLLLTVSLILFATFYYFLSFSKIKASTKVNIKVSVFMKYLSGWGKSIIVMGILFALTNWPGASMMLSIGIIVVIALSLAMLYYLLQGINDEIVSFIELLRNAILLVIAVYIYIEHFGTVLFVDF